MKKSASPRSKLVDGAISVKGYKGSVTQYYRLKRDIVLKAGTVFYPGPSRIDLAAGHGEAFIGLGRDNCMSVIVDMTGLDGAQDDHLRRVMRRAFEKVSPPKN